MAPCPLAEPMKTGEAQHSRTPANYQFPSCRYYTCFFQDSIQLYMVLDGHDGTKAVDFAQPRIPHHLLQQDFSRGERVVMEAFRRAIVNTDRDFFLRIDGHITRKLTLQMEIEVQTLSINKRVLFIHFSFILAKGS